MIPRVMFVMCLLALLGSYLPLPGFWGAILGAIVGFVVGIYSFTRR